VHAPAVAAAKEPVLSNRRGMLPSVRSPAILIFGLEVILLRCPSGQPA
jgi:hypothetical protein